MLGKSRQRRTLWTRKRKFLHGKWKISTTSPRRKAHLILDPSTPHPSFFNNFQSFRLQIYVARLTVSPQKRRAVSNSKSTARQPTESLAQSNRTPRSSGYGFPPSTFFVTFPQRRAMIAVPGRRPVTSRCAFQFGVRKWSQKCWSN